jgi:serine/threonine-protein kinase
MSQCPNCATELEDGARFCGACGTPVLAAAAAPPPPAPAPAPKVESGPAVARKLMAGAQTELSGSFRLAQANLAPGAVAAAAPPAAGTPAGGTPAPEARGAARPAPAGLPSGALRAPVQSVDSLVGRTLNHRYLVEDKIGEGGFGAVFRGKQIATGREVALKILHPHNINDQTIVARFRREAEACSKLRHPHTVTTYDFDETEDGVLYLAMELLRGRSLHQLQKTDGALKPERVLRIVDQVAQSLGEAHTNGIVHRDMKPENVFIETRGEEEDYVKVLDFGIAKMMSGDKEVQALTAVGQTLGTLEFMSPEQLRGQKLDGRSDIYALGMMAYEMLTGALPFQKAKTPIEIINFHLKQPPQPPSKMRTDVAIPAGVDEIILKMVAKNRDDRFADTAALRAEITKVQAQNDRSADRFEAYRLVAVIGAALVVGTLLYFLAR